jgi:hypothetical protein
MARSIEEVVARIDEATRAGFRGRLAERGLACNSRLRGFELRSLKRYCGTSSLRETEIAICLYYGSTR